MSNSENKMKNILVDCTPINLEIKGVGRYAFNIVSQLIEKNQSSNYKIYAISFYSELSTHFEKGSIETIIIPKTNSYTFEFIKVPRLIRKYNIDLYIKSSDTVGLYYSVPVITVVHDIDDLLIEAQGGNHGIYQKLYYNIRQFFRIYSIRNSYRIICNSEFVKRNVIEKYKVPENKIIIGYCGIDKRFYENSVKIRESLNLKNNAKTGYILTFATGDPRENYNILPQIIYGLKKEYVNAYFIIAGIKEKGYFFKLKDSLTTLNLIEEIDYEFKSFLGINKIDELIKLYTLADLYLELSLHEGFGMQLAEAMACGTTCISSPNGALSEVGAEYVHFIDPADINNIINVIKDEYKNLKKEDNYCQVEYTKKFNWDSLGISLHEIINQIGKRQDIL